MNTKHDHNPKLIYRVNEVLVLQTRSLPPRTFVVASGEAGTNATSARLVPSSRIGTPETLALDFEADDGAITVLTPVSAVREIELNGGKSHVTVHARINGITEDLPHGGKAVSAPTPKTITFTIDASGNMTPAAEQSASVGDTVKCQNASGVTTWTHVRVYKGTGASRARSTDLHGTNDHFSVGTTGIPINALANGKGRYELVAATSAGLHAGHAHDPVSGNDGKINVGGGGAGGEDE